MITSHEFMRRARRNPRALIVVVGASAILLGFAGVGLAAAAESNTRAELHAEIDDVTASVIRSTELGSAVVASHFTAAVCVAEISARLAAAGSSERFTPAASGRVASVVQRAADATPVPAYDPAPPQQPAEGAGVDGLRSVLGDLREALAATQSEVAALASAARAAEQACASARSAERVLVREIASRSDELIAANPKAAADAVSTLTAARDDAVAAQAGAVERWITAAQAMEASHAAVVLAEQQAADAARQAAERAAETSGPPVTFNTTPAPEPSGRKLTPEEVAALGMPPGSQIWEVPADQVVQPPLSFD